MFKRTIILGLVLMLGVVLLAACGGDGGEGDSPTPTATRTLSPSTPPPMAKSLTGAGATFPAPLYSKWFDEYHKMTGVQVNYQPIGSGGGIKAITDRTVDFGASDGIMSEAEEAAAKASGGPILHIPMTIGSVAIVYNVSGVKSGELKLTPDILADIFLGKIKRWTDPRLAESNPGLSLPDRDIAVVHRSDGSGTTYIFTDYLSKVSPGWAERVGVGKSVDWPVGIGGKGNDGVAAQVQQLPGSIGYVELAYAEQNHIPWAKLRNRSGNFVEPGLSATTHAAAGTVLPDDLKVMITDSAHPDAYPIAGFTWLLVYQNQPDEAKGRALVRMLWWAIHDGQAYCESLLYAPLPPEVVAQAEHQIRSINYRGTALIVP